LTLVGFAQHENGKPAEVRYRNSDGCLEYGLALHGWRLFVVHNIAPALV